MKKSDTISELAKALNKLQAEMPVVPMNAINPFFNNSKYADLGAIVQTSKPLLGKYGFSILQPNTSLVLDGVTYVGVNTILLHESGEWIEDTLYLPINEKQQTEDETDGDQKKKKKSPNHPQKAGIVITYLRRYGWASILGLYAEEDTDGNIVTDMDVVIKLRKDLKAIFDANPELQGQFKEAMKSLEYSNDTTDVSLIKKVIKQLESIKENK